MQRHRSAWGVYGYLLLVLLLLVLLVCVLLPLWYVCCCCCYCPRNPRNAPLCVSLSLSLSLTVCLSVGHATASASVEERDQAAPCADVWQAVAQVMLMWIYAQARSLYVHQRLLLQPAVRSWQRHHDLEPLSVPQHQRGGHRRVVLAVVVVGLAQREPYTPAVVRRHLVHQLAVRHAHTRVCLAWRSRPSVLDRRRRRQREPVAQRVLQRMK